MYANDLSITAPGQPSGRLQWCRPALRSIAFGAVFALVLTAPPTVRAETFSCGAGDVPCLIAAVIQANTNGQDANTIVLDAGTYTLTAVDNDTDGPNGLPSITSRLEIAGAGSDTTFIERAGSIPFRLIHVAATGNLTLYGLTLRGGALQAPGGAGVFNHGGSVTIFNAVLSGNSAGQFNGGGLDNAAGMVTLTYSILTGNSSAFGGGISNTGGGTVNITRSTLANNTGSRAAGGIYNSGTVAITDSLIDANRSGFQGGGIRNGGLVIVTNSVLSGNSASDGGGIYNNTGGTVTITHSTIVNNVGSAVGGGIVNPGGGTVTIADSTLASNRSFDPGGGGGIRNSGSLTITNSTFSRNSGRSGGAISNTSGTVMITSSTLSGNSAFGGGGISSDGIVALQNTIIALNSSMVAPDCSGIVTSFGNNLIGTTTNCSITLPQPGDLTGDPGLNAFTDDGTPGNGHYPLRFGSQAIMAANDSVCPVTDQLGVVRHHPCDIGAIEFRDRP